MGTSNFTQTVLFPQTFNKRIVRFGIFLKLYISTCHINVISRKDNIIPNHYIAAVIGDHSVATNVKITIIDACHKIRSFQYLSKYLYFHIVSKYT